MYHLGYSQTELKAMTDEEWAETIAILENIRKEESKRNPS